MIKLTTKPLKRYYFVKNGVVFEIKNTYNGTDECAILCGPDDNLNYLPSLTVTDENKGTSVVYYLDNLIVDGDTFDGTKFSKTIHKSSGDESSQTFIDYYRSLCEEKIEEAILKYNQDYEWFKKNINKLDIPYYMFETEGVTIESNEQQSVVPIDFTDVYFEDRKYNATKKASLDAANKIANKYQYKVERFEIDKIH